jgi:hypothetical protein
MAANAANGEPEEPFLAVIISSNTFSQIGCESKGAVSQRRSLAIYII